MKFKSIVNRIFAINADNIMGQFSKAIRNLESLKVVLESEVEEAEAKMVTVENNAAIALKKLEDKRDVKVAVLKIAAKDAEAEFVKTTKYLTNLKALLEG